MEEEKLEIGDQWTIIRPEECRGSFGYFDQKYAIHSQIQTRLITNDDK